MKKNGFTLIEILVVMGLIGILSTAGLSSYINTQRVARNSKRTADLKAIQGALESYFSNNGSYPPGCNPGSAYLPAGFPKDPQTGIQYAPATCTETAYCICTLLEGNTRNGNSTVNNCTNFASGTYFCVNQLQ
jgi:prepilin-type N-terminal cleavage/methylation domain-containing protein